MKRTFFLAAAALMALIAVGCDSDGTTYTNTNSGGGLPVGRSADSDLRSFEVLMRSQMDYEVCEAFWAFPDDVVVALVEGGWMEGGQPPFTRAQEAVLIQAFYDEC